MGVVTGNPTGRPPVLVEDGMKPCSMCGESLPVEAFGKDARAASGLHAACKRCVRSGQYVQRRTPARMESERRYRERHPERVRAAGRRHYHAKGRARGYIMRYGLTVEQYEEMLSRQAGACAICGHIPAGGERVLGVDHNHDTGAVRGLLCTACNAGIGLLGDDPELLSEAAEYLHRGGVEE